MPRDKVREALKKHSLNFTQTDDEIEVQAPGLMPVTSEAGKQFREWGVALAFDHDQLCELVFDAGFGKNSR
jgi:hypothetical protein